MKNFNKKIQAQFQIMCETGKLFRTNVNGYALADLYINSFENDPIFRDPNSSYHRCNICLNFIRRYGNIVAVIDNKITSMFDIEIGDEYEPVAKALSEKIKSSKITDVFFETYNELNSLPYESCSKNNSVFRLGLEKNTKMYNKEEAEKYGVVKEGEVRQFNHIHLDLPKQFVDMSGDSVESIMAEYREAKNVFLRGMETISLDTLNLVVDLINQGSLLDGTTHLHKIKEIIPLKKKYDKISETERDNWAWVNSYKFKFAKFRNELIGTLCSELSEGEEINKACQSWNKRVDPANYMKATAPITKKQIEEAKKFVQENGYEESFNRRFATIDDIKVSEILHINSSEAGIKKISIFDEVKPNSSRHKRNEFDSVEEVHIEKFMNDILPSCTSVEVFLKNSLDKNMVSMTTSVNKESKRIFKWDNNYSWTFNGNLAGKSQIKEAVKSHGGKVDGILRFSIMWAEDGQDNSDLDAHCIEPNGNRIYYVNTHSVKTGGNLDVDIRVPQDYIIRGKDVVENITYPELRRMSNGKYKFLVRQFSARNSKGFKAEIEFDGETYFYEYNRPIATDKDIDVAEVTLENGRFSIKHFLEETSGGSSKEIYGLETNCFHKVNLVCLSPNHWGENSVGNKHYFFMLNNCKTDSKIRGFHNENLIPELLEHRKVMEVLGNTLLIEPSENQLSGLGFNATVRDEVVVRLSGNFKRILKIKF